MARTVLVKHRVLVGGELRSCPGISLLCELFQFLITPEQLAHGIRHNESLHRLESFPEYSLAFDLNLSSLSISFRPVWFGGDTTVSSKRMGCEYCADYLHEDLSQTTDLQEVNS